MLYSIIKEWEAGGLINPAGLPCHQ
jgi:hypothetical protein